ncbi:hypothetical protein [Clostridium taeniosporum]|uniref:Uncharacterized protein n=1 Tax=Clostridium taeniosporum TaxID=394958 RepID=A0A1D7XP12_9CLOT|nr:hypothetical protein [Clostridium taeniosporum]AOR25056.1 hypothetical protein BGI42_15015 [Clostridium taeniosporum]
MLVKNFTTSELGYESKWNKEELKELPYCMNISELYKNLIFNLVNLKSRENKEVNCFLERFNNIEKLKKVNKYFREKSL